MYTNKVLPIKSGRNLDSLKKDFKQNLFQIKNKSSINQQLFMAG